ncbi:MAG: PorP/SprF family type IX secretion system membrane protein [Prevotellaceae bacterium]|nr:PorP/SprF family type IX secretion system membrane protein [Prevotellaceae bacterium]
MWYKILPAIAFMGLAGEVSAQQDAQFNLWFMNPTFINPGHAGNTQEEMFCASGYNRLELRGFDEAPVSTVLNVHGPVNIFGVRSGISVTLQNELAGFLRAPGLNLGYAYRHSLGAGEIGIGASLGFISSWYASNTWNLPDGSADPVAPSQENAGIAFDLGAGAYYSDSRWVGGLSFTHLTSPKLGVDNNARYRPTLYAMGGYTFFADSVTWLITPMLWIVSDFAQASYHAACHAMYKKKYWGGINYRWGQAIIAMAGMEVFDGLNIAYAYEYATSRLSRFSRGTHELMLSYSFAVKAVRGTQRYKSIRYL